MESDELLKKQWFSLVSFVIQRLLEFIFLDDKYYLLQ